MMTKFGQFVRELRDMHCQLLKDMADALDVSPAFLSAVEGGKKGVPQNWKAALVLQYELQPDQIVELQNAIDETQRSISLDLSSTSGDRRSIAVAFARNFEEWSDAELEEIRKTMATLVHKKRS